MADGDKLEEVLHNFKSTIEQMEEKRKNIFVNWIETQTRYLEWETNFNPKYLRAYKRGEIVLAHFGFNVGAEYGGMHYATIIRNSSKANSNLNIVPLTSMKDDDTTEPLHKDRVLLGMIEGLNDMQSVAIPDQIRAISKLRVIKPKKQNQTV